MSENERDWNEYRRNYNKEKYERVYIYLPPEEKKRWAEEASKRYLNISEFVKLCVEKEIGGG